MNKNVVSYLKSKKIVEENIKIKKNIKKKLVITLASFLALSIEVMHRGINSEKNYNSIIIEVNYDNLWNATIDNNGNPHTFTHKGAYTIILSKLDTELWDISGSFNKLDNSSERFSILIRYLNGSYILNKVSIDPYTSIEFKHGLNCYKSEIQQEIPGIREYYITPLEELGYKGMHRILDIIYCYGPIEFNQLSSITCMNSTSVKTQVQSLFELGLISLLDYDESSTLYPPFL